MKNLMLLLTMSLAITAQADKAGNEIVRILQDVRVQAKIESVVSETKKEAGFAFLEGVVLSSRQSKCGNKVSYDLKFSVRKANVNSFSDCTVIATLGDCQTYEEGVSSISELTCK